jgi:serine/threonine protein kinase
MNVKIGDFGLTVSNGTDIGAEYSGESTEGMHKSNVGTPLYMAPEVSSNEGYGFAIDVYAIGIIYFELLRPFRT